MHVALFGGTGFVGSYVIDALLAAGHEPVLLVRPGSEHKIGCRDRCRVVNGDVDDRDAIAQTLDGCDAAIYLIGILREIPDSGVTFQALQHDGAVRVIDAARDKGTQRFLLMSANGADARSTPYQETKFQAEQHLRESGLAYTVFRPSVIFGDPRDRMEFCTQLRDEMIRPPIPAPDFFSGLLPWRGGFDMSPVHVKDVAAAFVRSLEVESTKGQTYPLGGPEALSWSEIIRRIAAACGRRKLILPAPAGVVHAAAALFDRFAFFPITRDQLTMLMQGNTADSTDIFKKLDIQPHRFDVDELAYLQSK